MTEKNLLHWNPVEENDTTTYSERSLHSKMSKLNFDWKILDMLKDKRNSNNIRWFSAVLDKEVRKETDSIRNYINRRDDFKWMNT
ncbi:hypothetical protein LCGC14_2128230 [marine sediment metagenome]|uniref:Uncharacterized protein n=1 Tax=marine sediment metagenome TaxID=412755 RepID=A0A0F9GYC2_9ZZZZ